MKQPPTLRFSERVENYIKYRPSYPIEIVDLLVREIGLTPDHIIADIGSGTGILSKLFLENGNKVLGIEPNLEMRNAGQQLHKNQKNFLSLDGTAENTTLPFHSVDLIVAAQAFH